jgi:ribosomal protein S12 methylthiotransferase accessory factor
MDLTVKRPRFKRHLHVEIVDEDRVYLMHETGYHSLTGRLFFLLAPHVNGRNTVADIADRLADQLTPLDVRHGLALLEQEGLLIDGLHPDTAEGAFHDLLGIEVVDLEQRLQSKTVSITGPEAAVTGLAARLAELGVTVASDGDLEVALVDDYLSQQAETQGRAALDRQQPLLLARPSGAVVWLGPLLEPGQPGCWHCLAARVRRNRVIETWLGDQHDRQTPLPIPRPVLPTTLDTGLSLAATAIFRWVACGEVEELRNRLVTVDQISLQTASHTLVPRPACTHCGRPGPSEPRPIALTSCRKVCHCDGGYRTVFPEQTFKAIQHHVSPLTGIVRELKQLHQDSRGLVHVYMAGPNVTTPELLRRRGLRSKTAGKGMTEAQARTGAVSEALERYCAIFQGHEARRAATFAELGNDAVHPGQSMLFSRQQYQQREQWNRLDLPFLRVPEPFDEEQEIEWSPVWSLTEGSFKYLPTALCYFGYLQDEPEQLINDSNGNAAGNTIEEAILQGFLELVERDAVAIWWYNRLPRPGIDLESFEEPYFRSLQQYYRSLDRECWVLDLTADLGIPACAALSGDPGGNGEPLIIGFGAHLDVSIAVSRALTEMNQLLGNLLGGATSPFVGKPEGPYLSPDPETPLRKLSDFDRWQSPDLKQDITHCVGRAADQGIETLVSDLSRPDVELAAVKVFAPGLRFFCPRFAPGRLYKVPVDMGWLDQALAEDQLNPVHLRP